jgi:DNA-binding HxlR family transcriptional regulator
VSRTYAQHCGLARALDRIGERWTLLIVRELLVGPARYTDLREALPGMATNLLAERLRALEDQGIVVRRRLPPPAGTTVYELTELGRGLEEAVNALIRWGGRWMTEGSESDAFRPQWLALAVRALTRTQGTDGLPLTTRIQVDGHSFTLTLTESGVEVAVGEEPPAQVILATDARTMLAIASGARPLATVIEGGEVRAEGDPEAIATLGELWQGHS